MQKIDDKIFGSDYDHKPTLMDYLFIVGFGSLFLAVYGGSCYDHYKKSQPESFTEHSGLEEKLLEK